jgi:ABC-type branched-subunit amino acid transport system ATPase component/predicted MFS family arabinose efflux permease
MKLIKRYFENVTMGDSVVPLAILFFIYFFDEFDTAAFGVLVPEIKRAFGLSTAEFGTVVIMNLSVVLLLAVPVGHYGDRLPRRKLVFAGALVAGVFSLLTGMVGSVALLFLVRMGNGIGLLVNDPIHRSLLSDYYKPEARPQVFARHANAVRYGAILGPALAGVVAWLWDWRVAFMILIVPIVAMAIVSLRLKDPIRGETDNLDAAVVAEEEKPYPLGRSARILWSVKTLRRQYLAWLFIGPAFLPLAFLVPDYFEKVFGLSTMGRGLVGAAGSAAGLLGVSLGGRMTPKWFAQGMGKPAELAGLSLLAVGPPLLLFAVAPVLWLALVGLLGAYFVGGIFTPAFLSTQALVSPARVRSLSFAFGSVFLIGGVWLLWLNPILGLASINDDHGARWAIGVLVPYWIIGGLVLRSAGTFVEADVKRAMDVLITTADLRKQRLDLNKRSVLVVRGLDVSYGPVQVLFDVDFEMDEGEIVALLGTNGAGKSTLLRAISGLVPPQSGAIYFDGEDVTGLEPEESFQFGMVQVPGGRGIFPGLTVKENFDVACWASRRPKGETATAVKEVLEIFPSLERRWDQKAAVLSGGEAQMLTLGQALIAKPKLLMIDELSLGLAPVVVEELLKIVRRINADGTAVILVEQSVNVALTVAERACFMEKGEIRYSGPTSELLDRPDILRSVFLSGASAMEGAK